MAAAATLLRSCKAEDRTVWPLQCRMLDRMHMVMAAVAAVVDNCSIAVVVVVESMRHEHMD